MPKRFITIWFPHFKTDCFSLRQASLREKSFVLVSPDHGRMVITGANRLAQKQGVQMGMVLADGRAIVPSLLYFDEKPEQCSRLLISIAEWCIRYTPIVTIDPPDGLILDVTGCSHLWGGDLIYFTEIRNRLRKFGYDVRMSMTDTIGASWAITRFGDDLTVIASGEHKQALLSLPVFSLRLEPTVSDRLQKLGLRSIRHITGISRSALKRRFGKEILLRLDQALGNEEENVVPIHPVEPYQERLPCLEPITTAKGIEIALQRLLDTLCSRLQQEQKGLRIATFKGYRVDGKIEKAEIGTNRASHHTQHLFKLFELKLQSIEPALGIELFTLEASKVEDHIPLQKNLWEGPCSLDDIKLSELIDRLGNKIGEKNIHRYLPDEHHLPERSIHLATSLQEHTPAEWKSNPLRPMHLLSPPERIEVTAPIPDYPPMLFRYKGELHKIKKADGPERIEQEWWMKEGPHRDYYCVEDGDGRRYWLFRSGHYSADNNHQWYIHGFFA